MPDEDEATAKDIKGDQADIMDLYATKIDKQMNIATDRSQFEQVVESITYSSFNPVPSARKLQGDLYYLTVKTLDAGEKGITCSVNGFYVNDSIERINFSPQPS